MEHVPGKEASTMIRRWFHAHWIDIAEIGIILLAAFVLILAMPGVTGKLSGIHW